MNRITVNIPEAVNGDYEIKVIDGYTNLLKNGEVLMYDTELEYSQHQPLWDDATGDVLIGGLGIGMVNQKLMDNPNVTSVTIIEKNQEVIDLVWPHCPKDNTFTLINADITEWTPTQNYDYIWLDTWCTVLQSREWNPYNTDLYNRFKSYTPKIGAWLLPTSTSTS